MSEKDKLPKGWELKKLGEVADITSSKRIFQHEYVSEGIPFYRTKEIKELSEGLQISVDLYISTQKYEEIKSRFAIPVAGDVLLSAVGTIGISYVIKDNTPFYFKDGNLMWFRDFKKITSLYLSYALTNFIRNKNGAKTSGSAYNALTIQTMKEFTIPLPPLPEQEKIVAKIEELFSELDKGKEQLQTALQQLKVYRQGVLKYAFEGKLTNKNVKEGELPKGWKWVKLGDIAKKKSVKALPLEYPDAKFIGMDCIEPNTLKPAFLYDFKEFKSAGNYFEKGQVLYGRMRPYLNKVYKAEFDGACSGEFIVLDCTKYFEPELLKYILHSRSFVNFANHQTAGDRPRISYDEIAEYPIAQAPFKEQQQIVAEIERRLSVCDKIEETINQALSQTETLRQSILKKAFEGRLV